MWCFQTLRCLACLGFFSYMTFGGFVRDDVFDIGNCRDLGLEDSQGDISQIFRQEMRIMMFMLMVLLLLLLILTILFLIIWLFSCCYSRWTNYSNPGQLYPPRPPNFKVVFFFQGLRRVDKTNQTPQHDIKRTRSLTLTFGEGGVVQSFPRGLNILSIYGSTHCIYSSLYVFLQWTVQCCFEKKEAYQKRLVTWPSWRGAIPKLHQVPYIGTSLPFAIISTGTLGCTAVCYKARMFQQECGEVDVSAVLLWSYTLKWVQQVRCFEKDTSRQIRRSLQCNLFAVILLVQGVVFGCMVQVSKFWGGWMNMWCHCLSCYAGLWEQFEVTPIFTGQSIIPFPLMSSSATRSSFFLGSSLQSLAERFVFEWNKQKQTSWTTKMLIGTFFLQTWKNTSQTFCGSSENSGSMRIDLWIFYFCELLPGEVACTGGKNGSRWHGFSLRFSSFS